VLYVASARSTLESGTIYAARLVAATECPAERPQLLSQAVAGSMKGYVAYDGAAPAVTTMKYAGTFTGIGEPEPWQDNSPKQPDGVYNPNATEDSFTDVNGNGKWDADMALGQQNSIGEAGDIITYNVTYRLGSLVPFMRATMNGGQPFYQLGASTVVRNEFVFRDSGCT